MKRIVLLIVALVLTSPVFSAEKNVVFYLNDGSKKSYDLTKIRTINLKLFNQDFVMKVFTKNSSVAYFPVNTIDSLRFIQEPNFMDSLQIFIYGLPKNIALSDIDSICFNRLETKLKEGAVVFDKKKSIDIKTIDSSRIVIGNNSALLKDIAKGKIIVGEPSKFAPNGFLRRVLEINSILDAVELKTEHANITDVVESGIITFLRDYIPDDTIQNTIKTNQEPTLQGDDFTLGFSDIVIFDRDKNLDTKNDQITIDGTNSFKPKIGFSLIIDNWQVKQLLLQLTVEDHLELTAKAILSFDTTFQKSLNDLLKLPSIKLPKLTIWLGWFPFVICSDIDVQVGTTLSINAQVSTGVSLDLNASAGFEYNSEKFRGISDFSSAFNFIPPSLSIGGSIRGFVGPKMNINFYDVPDALNAAAGVYGFSQLDVSLLNKPLWSLWAGVEATADVSSKWFGLEYTFPLTLEYKKLLAQSNDMIDSISPSKGKSGDTLTIYGSGFGDVRGTNWVGFKRSSSLSGAIKATNFPLWSDEEIQVVIPNGLSAGTAQILLNLGGFLSNTYNFTIYEFPKIISINPVTAAPGEQIIINGSNFGSARNNSFVTFNDIVAVTYDSWSNSMIKLRVPAASASSSAVKISVTVENNRSNEVDFLVKQPDLIIPDSVVIGTQVWKTKNLDVEKYRNGDIIPQVQDQNQWRNLTTGAWCYYSNDTTHGKVYGKLYNWYAVNDARGLAPAGWHIPSVIEWNTLINFLGGFNLAGGALKETGFNHWVSPNTGATNSSGFYALPGGNRINSGNFNSIGINSFWWTSTESSQSSANYKMISNNNTQISNNSNTWKTSGYSIRCIKD